MAGLLQLPSAARRPRRPDPLRTTPPENHPGNDPRVNDLRQSYTGALFGRLQLSLQLQGRAERAAGWTPRMLKRHARSAIGPSAALRLSYSADVPSGP